MSIFADQKFCMSQIFELVTLGYKVELFDGFKDQIGLSHMFDTIKMVISKDGKIESPTGTPSIRYYDLTSKAMVGGIWTDEQGRHHRENAAATICERTYATGLDHPGDHWISKEYRIHGKPHNDGGPSWTEDGRNSKGEWVRTLESTSINGKSFGIVYRDLETGEIDCDSEDLDNCDHGHSDSTEPDKPSLKQAPPVPNGP